MRFYLSTMADMVMYEKDGVWKTEYENLTAPVAVRYGMGIELAEYCVSDNLDEPNFTATDAHIRFEKLPLVAERVLHAPYNELYPSAIDHRALELCDLRYGKAWDAAVSYGAKKMVVHSGWVPLVYYPSYFAQQAILYWKRFLAEHPGSCIICLENVMEKDGDNLLSIVKALDDSRIRLTFDVGHAHVTAGSEAIYPWLEKCAPFISHFHIHNNAGEFDTHDPLDMGKIDMRRFLDRAIELCPSASFTVECMDSEVCAAWLKENSYLEA